MQYRKFGKLDWKVSALGFGAMRLPLTDKEFTHVDEPESIKMLRYAIDNGVNYVDTAYVYHGGVSEKVVGKALKDGYREKVKLATKMPSFIVESPDQFDKILNEQLQRLQTDHIDFYLIHGLNKIFWPKMRDFKIIPWAEKALREGRIRHLGFSFHDELAVFKEIINYYDNFTFCQIQYNYMDENFQAGTKGLEFAASKGLAVVVMEPIRGGQLSRPPESVRDIMKNGGIKSTPAELALRWVWSHPEVSVTLSGMSNMTQVKENIASAGKYGTSIMGAIEVKLVRQISEEYRKLVPVPCTGCEYCQPCPNGVAIPQIFHLYNEGMMYNDKVTAKMRYGGGPQALKPEQRPGNCKECKECEKECPQNIPITEWLKKARTYLEE